MAIDAPERPRSPSGLSDLSSLTATSELDRQAEIYKKWIPVEEGTLEQNTTPADNERQAVDDEARSLALDLLERASQHPSEGQDQQGDEAASTSTRAATPRLDRTWSYRVENRNGTQGQPAGPSRITIAPNPVPVPKFRQRPTQPTRNEAPGHATFHNDAIKRTWIERAYQASEDGLLGTTSSMLPESVQEYGSNGTELVSEHQPPSKWFRLPEFRRSPIPHLHSGAPTLILSEGGPREEDPQAMAVSLPSTPVQAPVGLTSGEEYEVEQLVKLEETSQVQIGYGAEGSLVIIGDRSSEDFQNILAVLRRAQGRDVLLCMNPGLIPASEQAPEDDPMQGVMNGDNATVQPAAPVYGASMYSMPIEAPSNVPAGQAYPLHYNAPMTENPHYSDRLIARKEDTIVLRPARKIDTTTRVQRWIEYHRNITPQPIVEFGSESNYEGVAGDDFEDAALDDEGQEGDRTVIRWCAQHNQADPCIDCAFESIADL